MLSMTCRSFSEKNGLTFGVFRAYDLTKYIHVHCKKRFRIEKEHLGFMFARTESTSMISFVLYIFRYNLCGPKATQLIFENVDHL